MGTDGKSYIRSQSFAAPMHLSKPYWDGRCLIINPVNPTAGYFGGDAVDIRVNIGGNAAVAVTSPSATRIHQAREHQADMRLEQHITVASAGWLDWRPEMTIPQAGSRLRQSTVIHLEAGADLLYMESMAPGRVASGEAFQFCSLRSSTELYVGNMLTAIERYCLRSGDESLSNFQADCAGGYFTSGFLVAPRLPDGDALMHAVAELNSAGARMAASLLEPGVCVFKILAEDSLVHKQASAALAETIYRTLGRLPPDLRKL